jgi:hypothetical protein
LATKGQEEETKIPKQTSTTEKSKQQNKQIST